MFTIDRQLSEPFRIHQGMKKKEAHENALKMLYDVQIPNPEAVIRRRRMLMAETDFPEPDSPTTPRVFPASRE